MRGVSRVPLDADPMAEQEKKTFARQHELPKLAVPTLEESCKKYLVSLEALQVRITADPDAGAARTHQVGCRILS